MHLHAQTAAAKEQRAEKIAVIADTTIMKDYTDDSGNLHSAAQSALRIRPHLLQISAVHFDKHLETMPHGIITSSLTSITSCLRSIVNNYAITQQLQSHA